MKVFSDTFPADSLSAFEQHFIRENMLFVDIETTGLSPVRDQIYCIGCGCRKKVTGKYRLPDTGTVKRQVLFSRI